MRTMGSGSLRGTGSRLLREHKALKAVGTMSFFHALLLLGSSVSEPRSPPGDRGFAFPELRATPPLDARASDGEVAEPPGGRRSRHR